LATQYWVDKDGTNQWSDADAWGSASGVEDSTGPPAENDAVVFDGGGTNGDNNCTIDVAPPTLEYVYLAAPYDGDLDINDQDITTTANQMYDGAGEVKCGNGTLTCAGNFDNSGQGTWTREGFTVVMSGVGKTLTSGSTKDFRNLTLSGTIEVHADTAARVDVQGTFTCSGTVTLNQTLTVYSTAVIDGSLSVSNGKKFEGTGSAAITGSGTVTGAGECQLWSASSLVFAGTWSVTTTNVYQDLTLGQGTYGGTWSWHQSNAGTNKTVKLGSAGGQTITFTGDVTWDNDRAGRDYTIDCSTNNPDIVFQGDVELTNSAGNDLIWDKGTGKITLSGATNPQVIDFDAETIEEIEVDKTNVADVVQFTGGWTADAFEVTKGTIDFNEQTLITGGNFTMGTDSRVVADAAAMNGTDITVGGALDLDGVDGTKLTFNWTAAWTLTVTGNADLNWCSLATTDTNAMLLEISGTATAHNTDAEYSDASGFTEVDATDNCTDGENNTNWSFAAGGTTITATLGAISLAGFGADVAAGTTITASLGTLSIAGFNSEVEAGTVIAATLGAVAVAGQNSDVVQGATVSVSLGALAIAGFNVEVEEGTTIAVTLGAITVAGFNPKIEAGTTISASLGTLTVAGFNPEVTASTTIVVTLGAVTVTGFNPDVEAGTMISATPGALTITGYNVGLQVGQTPISLLLQSGCYLNSL